MNNPSTNPIYNIHSVIQETGIKEDTLRAWERRYNLPKPQRSDGGHRLFSEADIQTIKWLQSRLQEGMRISQAVELWRQQAGQNALDATDSLSPFQSPQPLSSISGLRDQWIESCLKFDERGAQDILRRAFAIQPSAIICDQIIREGLVQIGQLWFENSATVQQEHFASEIAVRQIHSLINAAPQPYRGKTILIGTPSGESHEIPILLTTLVLRDLGYSIVNLGSNVPSENILETIQTFKPDLVISSVSHVFNLIELFELAVASNSAGARFAFGGRVFVNHPELIEKIPANYLGDSISRVGDVVGQILNYPKSGITFTANHSADQKLSHQIQKAQNEIMAHVLQTTSNGTIEDLPKNLNWEWISQTFTRVLISALAMDNLALVEGELTWVRQLLSHRGLPKNLFPIFLSRYMEGVEKSIGVTGAELTIRLRKIISYYNL